MSVRFNAAELPEMHLHCSLQAVFRSELIQYFESAMLINGGCAAAGLKAASVDQWWVCCGRFKSCIGNRELRCCNDSVST